MHPRPYRSRTVCSLVVSSQSVVIPITSRTISPKNSRMASRQSRSQASPLAAGAPMTSRSRGVDDAQLTRSLRLRALRDGDQEGNNTPGLRRPAASEQANSSSAALDAYLVKYHSHEHAHPLEPQRLRKSTRAAHDKQEQHPKDWDAGITPESPLTRFRKQVLQVGRVAAKRAGQLALKENVDTRNTAARRSEPESVLGFLAASKAVACVSKPEEPASRRQDASLDDDQRVSATTLALLTKIREAKRIGEHGAAQSKKLHDGQSSIHNQAHACRPLTAIDRSKLPGGFTNSPHDGDADWKRDDISGNKTRRSNADKARTRCNAASASIESSLSVVSTFTTPEQQRQLRTASNASLDDHLHDEFEAANSREPSFEPLCPAVLELPRPTSLLAWTGRRKMAEKHAAIERESLGDSGGLDLASLSVALVASIEAEVDAPTEPLWANDEWVILEEGGYVGTLSSALGRGSPLDHRSEEDDCLLWRHPERLIEHHERRRVDSERQRRYLNLSALDIKKTSAVHSPMPANVSPSDAIATRAPALRVRAPCVAKLIGANRIFSSGGEQSLPPSGMRIRVPSRFGRAKPKVKVVCVQFLRRRVESSDSRTCAALNGCQSEAPCLTRLLARDEERCVPSSLDHADTFVVFPAVAATPDAVALNARNDLIRIGELLRARPVVQEGPQPNPPTHTVNKSSGFIPLYPVATSDGLQNGFPMRESHDGESDVRSMGSSELNTVGMSGAVAVCGQREETLTQRRSQRADDPTVRVQPVCFAASEIPCDVEEIRVFRCGGSDYEAFVENEESGHICASAGHNELERSADEQDQRAIDTHAATMTREELSSREAANESPLPRGVDATKQAEFRRILSEFKTSLQLSASARSFACASTSSGGSSTNQSHRSRRDSSHSSSSRRASFALSLSRLTIGVASDNLEPQRLEIQEGPVDSLGQDREAHITEGGCGDEEEENEGECSDSELQLMLQEIGRFKRQFESAVRGTIGSTWAT